MFAFKTGNYLTAAVGCEQDGILCILLQVSKINVEAKKYKKKHKCKAQH